MELEFKPGQADSESIYSMAEMVKVSFVDNIEALSICRGTGAESPQISFLDVEVPYMKWFSACI